MVWKNSIANTNGGENVKRFWQTTTEKLTMGMVTYYGDLAWYNVFFSPPFNRATLFFVDVYYCVKLSVFCSANTYPCPTHAYLAHREPPH